MKNNFLFKVLASFPMILVMLYFIPFLGVCLVLFRYFMYNDSRKNSIPLIIIGVGILILVPKGLYLLLDMIDFGINEISYLNDIVNSTIYNEDLINYSKFLITVGVIFFIVSSVIKILFNKFSSKLNSGVMNYINEMERKNTEISKQNDMEIKLKQERAKKTSYVKCPNCGSDNILSEKLGTCKYCRRKLENKMYKE